MKAILIICYTHLKRKTVLFPQLPTHTWFEAPPPPPTPCGSPAQEPCSVEKAKYTNKPIGS